MKTMQFRALLLGASSLAALALASPTLAQVPQQPVPPENYTQDPRGVDLVTGAFNYSTTEVVIGQPGQGGLAHGRLFLGSTSGGGWRYSLMGTINASGSVYTVSVGGESEVFIKSGSTYTAQSNRGFALTQSGSTYTFNTPSGATATFSTNWVGYYSPYQANVAVVTSYAYANGETLTYTYQGANVCSRFNDQGECDQTRAAARLQSVGNNRGYQIHYDYAEDDPLLGYDWLQLVTVTGFNLAVDYCAPGADDCTFSQTWPSITYNGYQPTTATDEMSRVTTYTYGTGGLAGIQYPGSSSNDIAVTYNGSQKVSGVTDVTGAWTYGYVDVSTTRTTTATGPLSQVITAVSDQTIGRATSIDVAGDAWTFAYDSQYRLERTTAPEGNYAEFQYDGFGNVTQTTYVDKAGSSRARNIVVSTAYGLTCSTLRVLCHRPTSTTDARGNVTTYTWDTTHGGLLSVQGPVPASGEAQPETRYGYSQLYAWYKNSGGSIVQAPTAVYLPTTVSACSTGTSCSGAANEVKTTVTYGATFGSFSTANNLLPTSIAAGAGDGSLTATTAMTYTQDGDLKTVDGPLSGTGVVDVAEYWYDDGRQMTSMVGPDPDGGGSLLNRAQRYTRNTRGQVTLTETGTSTGYTDPHVSGFTNLQQQETTYDGLGRPTQVEDQSSGGTTHALIQMSYDAAGRVECTAQRMNPNVFGSLPGSACSLGTQGAYGPDRIVKATFDAAGRPSTTTTAFGTGAASTETVTYTDNGQVETLTDGEANRSTLEYDDFDRVLKLRYPDPSTPNTSSTADYEEYGYDKAGNVVSTRTRASTIPTPLVFTATYDALNRVRTIDAPSGTADTFYTYDNLSRATRVADAASGGTENLMSWDALGRMLTQTGVLGTMSMQYDVAGRRTRLTWPDTVYVEYDYDVANQMTAIELSGSTQIVGYAYDNLGRRTGVSRANGITTSYGYDAVSRLTSLSHDLPGGTTYDQSWTYGYNPAGQVVTQTQSNDLYAYGGRTAATDTYTNNGLNQVTAVNATGVTYDANGNLTSDGAKTYVYDAANRPVSTNGGASTLSYDPLGRLRNMVGTSGAQFLYEGAALAGAVANGGSTVANRIIQGPWADEIAVAYQGSVTTDPRWSLQDRLGSVVAITDGSAAVNVINSYDEYGRPASGNGGRMMYTGQMWLPDFGVYHYKARQYHPGLGRFLQTDPMGYGAGANLYAYVGGDPVNRIDPTGRLDLCATPVRYTGTYANSGTRDGFTWTAGEVAWSYVTTELRACEGNSTTGDGSGSVEGSGGSGDQNDSKQLQCLLNYLAPRVSFSLTDVRFHRGGHLFNRFNNSVTIESNIYLLPAVYDQPFGNYNDTWHVIHEIGHIPQWSTGRLTRSGALMGYGRSGNHDGAWFEVEANNFANTVAIDVWNSGVAEECAKSQ